MFIKIWVFRRLDARDCEDEINKCGQYKEGNCDGSIF